MKLHKRREIGKIILFTGKIVNEIYFYMSSKIPTFARLKIMP